MSREMGKEERKGDFYEIKVKQSEYFNVRRLIELIYCVLQGLGAL